jgi:putative transposase
MLAALLRWRQIMARPPRISGHAYVGMQRYFITSCTENREPAFDDPRNVSPVVEQFLNSARRQSFAIHAYCVMPNHIHLLVEGLSETARLESFVKLAKQHSGYEFRQRCGTRLWQEGYYDRVLRTDEETEEVVLYIVNNPVRSGIVQEPDDYPYWGSSVYSRQAILEMIAARSEQ